MDSLYSIGDKVFVRSFEDLCDEFDAWPSGDLKTPATFVTKMQVFCGLEVTIADVREFVGDFMYIIEEDRDGYLFDECVLRANEAPFNARLMSMSFEDAVGFTADALSQ